MKKPSLHTVRTLSVVFLLGILFTLSIAYVSRIGSEKEWVVLVRPQVLTDPLYTHIDDNVSSAIVLHEMVQRGPAYRLHRNEVRIYSVSVNFPAFLSQTFREQRHFFEEIGDVKEYDLQINVAGEDRLDMRSIRGMLTKLPPFKSLTLALFDYPPNYLELFDTISWPSSPDVEFTVMMHGAHFPYGFSLDDIVLRAKKMTERNNGSLPLRLFDIASGDQSSMRFRLGAEWEKALQYFPAKKIWASNIGINSGELGDAIRWRQRVEAFLRDSPAEEIFMGDVRKEIGKITIWGF